REAARPPARAPTLRLPRPSLAEGTQALRVDRAALLVDLQGESQKQRRYRGAHHDIGEDQGLQDGVDGRRRGRPGVEDRRHGAEAVAYGQQSDVGGRLHDRQTSDQVDVMTAGYYAVNADGRQPRCCCPGHIAHGFSPPRVARVSSRNSSSRRMNPAVTATATPAFSTRMRPPARRARVCPKGSTFSRNAAPLSIGNRPQSTSTMAPAASSMSKISECISRRQRL